MLFAKKRNNLITMNLQEESKMQTLTVKVEQYGSYVIQHVEDYTLENTPDLFSKALDLYNSTHIYFNEKTTVGRPNDYILLM